MRLHLEPGARLWASPELKDYVSSAAPQTVRGLVLALDAEDVAVTGMGEIHGQSPQWIIPWMNENPPSWGSLQGRRPGRMIVFRNCRRVSVEGVRIFDSPRWTLVFEGCRHVRVHGVMMRHFDAINADGIDLVDTSNAVISDCDLHVTDDGICLKTDGNNPSPAGAAVERLHAGLPAAGPVHAPSRVRAVGRPCATGSGSQLAMMGGVRLTARVCGSAALRPLRASAHLP